MRSEETDNLATAIMLASPGQTLWPVAEAAFRTAAAEVAQRPAGYDVAIRDLARAMLRVAPLGDDVDAMIAACNLMESVRRTLALATDRNPLAPAVVHAARHYVYSHPDESGDCAAARLLRLAVEEIDRAFVGEG